MGAKQEPSLTLTKLRPALESRRVRTQPRTVTSPPTGSLPASACSTLTVVMPWIPLPCLLHERRSLPERLRPRLRRYTGGMPIQLAPAALQRVRGFLAETPAALGLRFGVKRTGCSGWGYLA